MSRLILQSTNFKEDSKIETDSTNIINNGSPISSLESLLGTLANNKGKNSLEDAESHDTNTLKFDYNGNIGSNLDAVYNNNYSLGLTFSVPKKWN